MASKSKQPSQAMGLLALNVSGALPLWDEAQIQQENWGGSLGLPAKAPGAVVELRHTEGRIVVTPDEGHQQAFGEFFASFSGQTMTDDLVHWKRPVDIFAPFRPMVHRNTTPFLFPYDKERGIFDSKAAEETAKSATVLTGKKSEGKSAAPPIPLHVQFPETVHVLEPQALEVAVKEWSGVSSQEVIARYRELQPLMQAYDPNLELGCAATPAEACKLSYSTAVRHRVKEVEEMSRLSEPPLFVMDAFNSALKFLENAQASVKSGEYLWELIYPHAPGTCHPVYNPHGKYCVRLFIDGAFRRIVIDDYLPVDVLGRPFLSFTSQKEIWPALLAKALFVALKSNCHLLFTDPETIVSCLRGGWVPQRIDPRIQPAAACALLLACCKDHVKSGDPATEFPFSVTNTMLSAEAEEGLLSQKQGISEMEQEDAVKAVSNVSFGNTHPFLPEGEDTRNASDSPVVCALSSLACERRKLFVIHNIVFFRTTLAIQISTNPPISFIQAKELTEETKDEGVQEFLRCASLGEIGRKPFGSTSPSKSMLWVTFEELSAHLDLVVWRNFDEESPFRFSSRLTGAEEASSVVLQAKKKTALPGLVNPVSPSRRRHTERWIHLASDKSEQVAFISLGTMLGSASPMITQKSGMQSVSLLSRPLSAQSCARSTDSKLIREDLREVFVDLYTWQRGDMLSPVGEFLYEPDKLHCMVHTLPAGSHVLRVTTLGLEASHVLAVLATHNFIMGDKKDVFSAANIFKMSDAGTYAAVERANEEVLWFKRLITVKETTTVSFVVSTLEASEDPANHRDIPAVLLKDSKGTKARAMSSKTSQKEPVEETLPVFFDVPVISFCRILLMDLDKGTFCTGAVGRLVRQRLEPNQQGYLVMAYVLVNVAPSASLKEGFDSVVSEISTKEPDNVNLVSYDEKDENSLRDKPPLLTGKGVWKLTISADHVLDSYKPILQNMLFFSEEGQLKRGSNSLLFAYVCTVFERTSFTLLLDLDARDNIPFYIRVTRSGVETQPTFVSDTCVKHLFLPHVTLDLPERSKKGIYVIEAWLDKTKVQEWEERRRMAQETKFRTLRSNAEQKVMQRYQKEVEEYKADPRAFIEQMEQKAAVQAEPAAPSSLWEASCLSIKKGNLSFDNRKNQQGGMMPEQAKFMPTDSMVMPEPGMLSLDTTDEDLIVRFDLRLHFSSKVEVKNAAPLKDPLTCLRAAWGLPTDHFSPDPGSQNSHRGSSTKIKQREAALSAALSAEELLKADQGRVSRQRFLENPRNVLTPYLVTYEEEITPNKEAVRTGTPKEPSVTLMNAPRVVIDPLEEANFLHAPILNESQYCIEQHPISAVEVAPPLHQTPPSSSSGFFQQRSKSPMDRLGTRVGTAGSVAMDEDLDVAELKTSLQELLRRQLDELKQEHEKRVEGRENIKNVMRQYWSGQRPDTPLISLLTHKEDEALKRRARVKMN